MSPHIEAIRENVTLLVDHIELARRDSNQRWAWVDRHPIAYAIGSLGVELFGAWLLARAKRRRRHVPMTWSTPANSDGIVN